MKVLDVLRLTALLAVYLFSFAIMILNMLLKPVAYIAAVFSGFFWWDSARMQLTLTKNLEISPHKISPYASDVLINLANQMNVWAGVLALVSAGAFWFLNAFGDK